MSSTGEQHVDTLNSITRSSFSTDGERAQAKRAAAALLMRLEDPVETVIRLIMTEISILASLKVCHDLKLFSKWCAGGEKEHKTAPQLAEMTGCNVDLLRRHLRNLASNNFLNCPVADTYTLTPFTVAMSKPPLMSFIPYGFDVNIPGLHHLPSFLASIGHTNPADPTHNCFQQLRGMPGFDFINATPERANDFQAVMQAANAAKQPWTEVYPVPRLLENAKPDRALFVDVGGSHGRDAGHLPALHPDLPKGAVIVQDLPETIAQVKPPPGVEVQGHSFFNPQHVKGARAYYLHCVLHDWPDDDAVRILSHIANAMEREHSRVLVHETVVMEDHNDPVIFAADLTMMMFASARERTEEDWRRLFARAGLRVEKVWKAGVGRESVIEGVLADA